MRTKRRLGWLNLPHLPILLLYHVISSCTGHCRVSPSKPLWVRWSTIWLVAGGYHVTCPDTSLSTCRLVWMALNGSRTSDVSGNASLRKRRLCQIPVKCIFMSATRLGRCRVVWMRPRGIEMAPRPTWLSGKPAQRPARRVIYSHCIRSPLTRTTTKWYWWHCSRCNWWIWRWEMMEMMMTSVEMRSTDENGTVHVIAVDRSVNGININVTQTQVRSHDTKFVKAFPDTISLP